MSSVVNLAARGATGKRVQASNAYFSADIILNSAHCSETFCRAFRDCQIVNPESSGGAIRTLSGIALRRFITWVDNKGVGVRIIKKLKLEEDLKGCASGVVPLQVSIKLTEASRWLVTIGKRRMDVMVCIGEDVEQVIWLVCVGRIVLSTCKEE